MWHNTNILTMLPRYFKDSYYKGETFDYKSMVSSSPDGKAVCKITQLVAVDLGDPKDPNRKIIENTEFAWVGDNKYHKLKDSDGYAVLGISEITITDKPSVTDLFPCTVTIYNDDWYQMPENARNPKMPNRNYGIMPYDPKYESFIFRVDVSNLAKGTVYYVKGTLIPKGNFSSNRPFDIKFSGFGNWHGSVETIYSGKLNPEYSQ